MCRICSSLHNHDGEYIWLHFEEQDGRHGCFFSVMKSAYISIIIGPIGPLLQGQTSIAKFNNAYYWS